MGRLICETCGASHADSYRLTTSGGSLGFTTQRRKHVKHPTCRECIVARYTAERQKRKDADKLNAASIAPEAS